MGNPTFIAIGYPHYRVTSGQTRANVPLGHAGFISVGSDGSAKYYEYGLYQPDQFTNINGENSYNKNGSIRSLELNGIEFDSSGNITENSLQMVLGQIVGVSGMYKDDTGMIFASNFKITDNQLWSIFIGRCGGRPGC